MACTIPCKIYSKHAKYFFILKADGSPCSEKMLCVQGGDSGHAIQVQMCGAGIKECDSLIQGLGLRDSLETEAKVESTAENAISFRKLDYKYSAAELPALP